MESLCNSKLQITEDSYIVYEFACSLNEHSTDEPHLCTAVKVKYKLHPDICYVDSEPKSYKWVSESDKLTLLFDFIPTDYKTLERENIKYIKYITGRPSETTEGLFRDDIRICTRKALHDPSIPDCYIRFISTFTIVWF